MFLDAWIVDFWTTLIGYYPTFDIYNSEGTKVFTFDYLIVGKWVFVVCVCCSILWFVFSICAKCRKGLK